MKKLLLSLLCAGPLAAVQETNNCPPAQQVENSQQGNYHRAIAHLGIPLPAAIRQPQNQGEMGEHPIVTITAAAAFGAIIWMLYMVVGKSFAR